MYNEIDNSNSLYNNAIDSIDIELYDMDNNNIEPNNIDSNDIEPNNIDSNDVENEIVLENVLETNNNKFLFYIKALDLVKLFKKGKLIYNSNTQRGTEIKNIKGELVEQPILKKSKVLDIKKDILDKKFQASLIVLNISDFEEKDLIKEYSNNQQTLLNLNICDKPLEILDGYHRISALNELVSEGHEDYIKDIEFSVQLCLLNENEAQQYFRQLCLGAPISKSRISFFDNDNVNSYVVKKLMENSLSERVETTKNTINKNNLEEIVTFATLTNALKFSKDLDVLNKEELENFINYLNVFFEELLTQDIFSPFFEDPKLKIELSKNSFAYDNFMFYAYIKLAVELYNEKCEKSDYSDFMNDIKIINKIDFSKNGDMWKTISHEKVNVKGEKTYTIPNNSTNRKLIGKILVIEFKRKLSEEKNNKVL